MHHLHSPDLFGRLSDGHKLVLSKCGFTSVNLIAINGNKSCSNLITSPSTCYWVEFDLCRLHNNNNNNYYNNKKLWELLGLFNHGFRLVYMKPYFGALLRGRKRKWNQRAESREIKIETDFRGSDWCSHLACLAGVEISDASPTESCQLLRILHRVCIILVHHHSSLTLATIMMMMIEARSSELEIRGFNQTNGNSWWLSVELDLQNCEGVKFYQTKSEQAKLSQACRLNRVTNSA